MTETDNLLQVHTKDEIYDLQVSDEITAELATLLATIPEGDEWTQQVYYEGAIRALATMGAAYARQKGTPLYTGRFDKAGFEASRNARSCAQFLWRNGLSGGYMPCVDGTLQPYSTKLSSAQGVDLCLSLWPSNDDDTCSADIQPWDAIEL